MAYRKKSRGHLFKVLMISFLRSHLTLTNVNLYSYALAIVIKLRQQVDLLKTSLYGTLLRYRQSHYYVASWLWQNLMSPVMNGLWSLNLDYSYSFWRGIHWLLSLVMGMLLQCAYMTLKNFQEILVRKLFIQEWNTVIEFGQHVHFLGKILQNFPP